jgi:hypothetical protein
VERKERFRRPERKVMETTIFTSLLCFLLGFSGGLAFNRKGISMPLTKKGEKLKKELQKEYGAKKGKQVLYAMENKGTAKGITKKTAKKATKKATKRK